MSRVNSPLLRVLAWALLVALHLISLFLFWRGHQLPGGGFIAGLVTAIGWVLMHLAWGPQEMAKVVRCDPARVAFVGMGVALVTALFPLMQSRPFFEHLHFRAEGGWTVGTPMLFDLGVYLVVVGIAVKILFVFSDASQGHPALLKEEEKRYASPIEEPVEGSSHAD